MRETEKLKLSLSDESDGVGNTRDGNNANFEKIEEYTTGLTQICSAISPSALTLKTSHQKINFTQIVKSGYVFALSNGGVKVTEPGFVVADFHVHVRELKEKDSILCELTKNGSTMWTFENIDSVQTWVTTDIGSRLIPCAADDVFGIILKNSDANRGAIRQEACYLTLKFFKDLNFAGV